MRSLVSKNHQKRKKLELPRKEYTLNITYFWLSKQLRWTKLCIATGSPSEQVGLHASCLFGVYTVCHKSFLRSQFN